MDWTVIIGLAAILIAFLGGRFSARYRFLRIRRRYKQNVGEFIRGR